MVQEPVGVSLLAYKEDQFVLCCHSPAQHAEEGNEVGVTSAVRTNESRQEARLEIGNRIECFEPFVGYPFKVVSLVILNPLRDTCTPFF